MTALFWFCAFLMVYVYVGYPLLASLVARLLDRTVRKAPIRPTVTVIVAAYNEEKSICRKLDNLRALDYPPELLDVLVASDASSDATDRLVTEYSVAKHEEQRIKLLRIEGRRGKTACQNVAVAAARGEIVVFTDATTEIDASALHAMIENFADPAVGCVAGRLIYVDTQRSSTGSGGTAYWEYELSLRKAETLIGSLVGVSGCLYAVRKSAYQDISADLISDFVIALKMREQGLRTVLEPSAICREETLVQSRQELSMRVRVALRSITALVRERRCLNPFQFGSFAWQLWSHKALRYASPFIWAVLFITSVVLSDQPLYLAALCAQLLLLIAGLLGWLTHAKESPLLAKPYYFLLTNVASLLALFRFMRGDRVTVWKTVR